MHLGAASDRLVGEEDRNQELVHCRVRDWSMAVIEGLEHQHSGKMFNRMGEQLPW